jgi:hypothetical protein
MNYRHTDKPVQPVRAVAPLRGIWPVGTFLVAPIARVSVAKARAFYANRLRKWAKDKKAESDGED